MTKLLRKKETWTLTVAGWLLLLGALAGFLFLVLVGLYPFLSPSKPVSADVLVVEGWLEDAELPQVVAVFEKGAYQRMIVTGCDITFARDYMPYPSYAEVTYHRLLDAGVAVDQLGWVTYGLAPRDRTFCSALALRDFLKDQSAAIDVITVGPHARRSQRLFQLAMGASCKVGIISIEPQEYDGRSWWKCSDGFRKVVDEAVAWFYARWIFDPDRTAYEHSA